MLLILMLSIVSSYYVTVGLKVKVKYLWGAFGGAGYLLSDHIFHALGAKL